MSLEVRIFQIEELEIDSLRCASRPVPRESRLVTCGMASAMELSDGCAHMCPNGWRGRMVATEVGCLKQ